MFVLSFLVPGLPKGPGGVIVCCEDKLVYKTTGENK